MIAEVTLQLSDFGVIGGMMLAFASVNLWNNRALALRVQRAETRLDAMQESKVGKMDWLRESRSTREKVDYGIEQISALIGRLDGMEASTAASHRVAKAVEDLVRQSNG